MIMSQGMVQLRRAVRAEVSASVTARRAFAVVTFALLAALSARFALPLPATAVPLSLQTLVVLMSGLLLGPVLGASAMTMYLIAGAAGVPVFVAGMGIPYLFGPTGGYLLAFPAAAAVAGAVAARAGGSRSAQLAWLTGAAVLATAVVYAGGWAQLSVMTGDTGTAFRVGVLPFLAGDMVKIVAAVVLASRLRRRALALL
jgi:biotin transport system substrate-specific component